MDDEMREFYIQAITDEIENAEDEDLIKISEILGLHITRVTLQN